jgi:hypothetical protein
VAIVNGYTTLNEVKDSLNLDDSIENGAIELAIATASRMIDDYCGRFFYKDGTVEVPAIRYYTPNDFYTVVVDDFVSLSEIATDDNFDQLYQTIWTASDSMFEPVNNPSRGWPRNRILAVGAYVFPANLPQSVRLKGIFGWSSVPYEVRTAAKIQASRLFLRNQSPFGIAGNTDMGTVRLSAKLDADVEALLRPMRKNNGLAY